MVIVELRRTLCSSFEIETDSSIPDHWRRYSWPNVYKMPLPPGKRGSRATPRDLLCAVPGIGILVLLCVFVFHFGRAGRDRSALTPRYRKVSIGRDGAMAGSLSVISFSIIAGAAERSGSMVFQYFP